MGAKAGLNRHGKFHPHRDFSFFVLLSFALSCLPILYLYVLCARHLLHHDTKRKHPCPGRDFFILLSSVCTSFVLGSFVLTVLHFAFCLYSRHTNTNIHAPCEIRTRNPNKQSAADPSLRPLGHWDRRNSIPEPSSS